MNTTKYLQTPYDKAFIRTVEYLHTHRDQHLKFRTRKELLHKLGIHESNYTSIKKGERGVPRDKYDVIRKYLKDHFDVNEEIFKHNKGDVLLHPFITEDHEGAAINLLKAELDNCKSIIEEKNRLIEFQQITITMLQKTIENLTARK